MGRSKASHQATRASRYTDSVKRSVSGKERQHQLRLVMRLRAERPPVALVMPFQHGTPLKSVPVEIRLLLKSWHAARPSSLSVRGRLRSLGWHQNTNLP